MKTFQVKNIQTKKIFEITAISKQGVVNQLILRGLKPDNYHFKEKKNG